MQTEYLEGEAKAALEAALGLTAGELGTGRIAIVGGLDPDEPVFALRGHDKLAAMALSDYRLYSHKSMPHDRWLRCCADIDAVFQFQNAHPERVREPD